MMPLETMGQITDAEGKASLFYIKCDDPANDNAVIQEIHATHGLEDYPVESVDDGLTR
jgi:putative ABC transport system permease protein